MENKRNDLFSAPDLRKNVADLASVFRDLAAYSTQANVPSHVANACVEAGRHILAAQRVLSAKADDLESKWLDSLAPAQPVARPGS